MSSTLSPYDPMTLGSEHRVGNGYNNNHLETTNGLVVDGNYIDGSWELSVFVEDLHENVTVRVLGGVTLGGLMHRIVEGIKIQQSWSDHGIWWIDRNMWLLHSRTTLDQYGIQSNAKLMFRRTHGDLQVFLPSMVPVVLRVNYSSRVFNVVSGICKELSIRHPEELSLTFPITRAHLKANTSLPKLHHGGKTPNNPIPPPRSDTATLKTRSVNPGSRPYPVLPDGAPISPYGTLHSAFGTMKRLQSDSSLDQERLDVAQYADCNFRRSAKNVFGEELLMKPKNLIQKARLNSGWLDSSRSLLEQGVKPPSISSTGESIPPTLHMLFKYYNFYDINLKSDAVRIHQLYEQGRWSLLSGVLDCTEDEMIVFAAYQLQAELQSSALRQVSSPSPYVDQYMTNYYPTLGAGSTIGTAYAHPSRPSPDFSRKHYLSSSPAPYTIAHSGNNSSLMRLPGAAPSLSGTSVMDGTLHRMPSESGAAFDEVDELLAELEQSCGVAEEPGSTARSLQPGSNGFGGVTTLRSNSRGYDVPDTSEIPSLQDTLRVFKDRAKLLRRYKLYWVVIRETRLFLYRNERELDRPIYVYSLNDCSVTPDVSTATHKYVLKLSLVTELSRPTDNGLNGPSTPFNTSASLIQPISREEVWLRFEAAEQYARWLSALRLIAKGKTLASQVAYKKEMETILEILRLQVPGLTPSVTGEASLKYLGDLTDFCAERIIRKARSKDHLRQRISEAHVNIRDLSLLDAKYKYIQAWQRLTSFGKSYFTVLFDQSSKAGLNYSGGGYFSPPLDDLIAISPSGIEILSPYTGEVLRSWTFMNLRSWNVNWDVGKVALDFRSDQISFRPLCANCKSVAEFIGGYVFLSQRTPEGSQALNERLFYRLTGTND